MFLGGVIVLVVYITTLAANEKLTNKKGFAWALLGPGVFLLGMAPLLPFTSVSEGPFHVKVSVTSLFEAANTALYLFSVFYLLLALVCVVKVIKLEKGPLVKRT